MARHVQCLRCFAHIPVKPEMVGMVILCPTCMERVYVTDASQDKSASSSSADAPSPAVVSAHALGRPGQSLDTPRPLPIGLIVSIAGLAISVLIAGFIMWRTGSSPAPDSGSKSPTTTLPPPPPTIVSAPPPAPPEVAADPNSASEKARGASPAKSLFPPPKAPLSAAAPLPPSATARWPEVWRLPPASSSGSEVLTSADDSQTAWKLSVKSASADYRTGPIVNLEPDSDPQSWTLKPATNFAAAGGREPFAILKRSGADLTLAWANPANPQAGPQVANCLLEINDGQQRRTGQLREPVKQDPISLDLTTSEQTVEPSIADLPKWDGLCLEITDLKGFSSEPKLRGDTKMTKARSQALQGSLPLVIEFADIPGLEIRLRIAGNEGANKFALSLDPVYHDGQTTIDDLSTSRQLNRLEEEAQKSLVEARRKLQTAEPSLARWQAKEKDLKSDEPLASDRRRHPIWQTKYQEAKSWVAKSERDVDSATKTLKTAQARLDAIPKVRAFTKASHEQAKIHYILYSECGDTDLLLIDARGE